MTRWLLVLLLPACGPPPPVADPPSEDVVEYAREHTVRLDSGCLATVVGPRSLVTAQHCLAGPDVRYLAWARRDPPWWGWAVVSRCERIEWIALADRETGARSGDGLCWLTPDDTWSSWASTAEAPGGGYVLRVGRGWRMVIGPTWRSGEAVLQRGAVGDAPLASMPGDSGGGIWAGFSLVAVTVGGGDNSVGAPVQ